MEKKPLTREEKLTKIEQAFEDAYRVYRDYYVIDWPVTTRKWEFGTYVKEILQNNKIKP